MGNTAYDLLRRWTLWGGRARTAGQARGAVLELGIGGGANLPHYRQPAALVGIDLRPSGLLLTREGARACGFPAAGVCARGETLPFAAASFDTVTGALVLCSVQDPGQVLDEVRRVLRPGGELRLMEHVLPASGALRPLIRLLAPVWAGLTHECRLDRDTVGAVRRAGFEVRELRTHAGGLFVEVVAGRGEGG